MAAFGEKLSVTAADILGFHVLAVGSATPKIAAVQADSFHRGR